MGHGLRLKSNICDTFMEERKMNQDTDRNDGLVDILKMIADKRMEETLGRAFCEDQALKALSEAVIGMEAKYESLELEPGIREAVDQLLAERDGVNAEKVSLAYLAGMKDVIFILREWGVIAC